LQAPKGCPNRSQCTAGGQDHRIAEQRAANEVLHGIGRRDSVPLVVTDELFACRRAERPIASTS